MAVLTNGCATTTTSERHNVTPWLDRPVLARPDARPVRIDWERDGSVLTAQVLPSKKCVLSGERTLTHTRVHEHEVSYVSVALLVGAGAAIAMAGVVTAANRDDNTDSGGSYLIYAGGAMIGAGIAVARLRPGSDVETLSTREETRQSKTPVACLKRRSLVGLELGIWHDGKVLAKGKLDRATRLSLELPSSVPEDSELALVVTEIPPQGAARVMTRGLVVDRLKLADLEAPEPSPNAELETPVP